MEKGGVLLKKMTQCHFNVVSRNPDGSISIRKASRRPKQGSSNTKVVSNEKKSTWAKLSPISKVCQGKVILDLPLRTKSEANCFEHWHLRHKRHKAQQALVALALKPLKENIKLPCRILLTRFAPKKLDKHDNLPMSFKYIVDAVCSIITGNFASGQADSDERISISYDQIESQEYGIRIEVASDV